MAINGTAEPVNTLSYKLTLTPDAAKALMQVIQNQHPDDADRHVLVKQMVFTLLQNAGCSV